MERDREKGINKSVNIKSAVYDLGVKDIIGKDGVDLSIKNTVFKPPQVPNMGRGVFLASRDMSRKLSNQGISKYKSETEVKKGQY